jgi:hypothetical protein
MVTGEKKAIKNESIGIREDFPDLRSFFSIKGLDVFSP